MGIRQKNLRKKKDYFRPDGERSTLKKRAVRSAGVTILAQSLLYGTQMVGTIVLARILAPNDFGLVAMVSVFSYYLMSFCVNGFTEAIIQKDNIGHNETNMLFWINIAFSLTLTLLFMAGAPILAGFYKEPRLNLIIITVACSIFFTGCSAQHIALLKRNLQFHLTAANEVVAGTTGVAIAILLAMTGWGYWAIVARRVFPELIMAIGAWILCDWRPTKPDPKVKIMSTLKFIANVNFNFSIRHLTRNLDKLLIGRFHGAIQLGHYDRAYYLFVMPMGQLIQPISNLSVAVLSKLKDSPGEYKRYYLRALSTIAFIGMPLSAILTLIGTDFIYLLIGPNWSEAGRIFTIFGPSIGIALLSSTNIWLHLSLGRADRWSKWNICAIFITVLLFFAGISYGATGIAVAYSVSFHVLLFPGLLYAGKPIDLKISMIVSAIWRHYVSALAAGGISWLVLYHIEMTSIIFSELYAIFRILVALFLCLSTYIFAVILLHRGTGPITEFFSLIHDMVPARYFKSSKKRPPTS